MPQVSIIMPAYNAAATIGSAVRSLLNQSMTDWELLVADDGSTDCTVALVGEVSGGDRRIRVLRTSGREGPAGARNCGLAEARGRYIAFLDADDIWVADKLSIQLAAMQASGSPFCYASYVTFHDGEVMGRLYQVPASTSYRMMLKGSVIGCLTVIYDRERLGVEYFDNGAAQLSKTVWSYLYQYIGHEDYVTWMRLLRRIDEQGLPKALGITQPLAYYRISAKSFSSSKLKVAVFQYLIYRLMLGTGRLRSLCYMISYALRGVLKRIRPAAVVPVEVP